MDKLCANLYRLSSGRFGERVHFRLSAHRSTLDSVSTLHGQALYRFISTFIGDIWPPAILGGGGGRGGLRSLEPLTSELAAGWRRAGRGAGGQLAESGGQLAESGGKAGGKSGGNLFHSFVKRNDLRLVDDGST